MAVMDDLNRLPLWGQVGIMAGLGIAVGLAYYFMSYKADQTTIRNLDSQIKNLKIQLTTGKEARKKRKELDLEIEKIEAKINQLKRILPEEFEISDVFDEVTNRLKDAGLQLTRYSPKPVREESNTYRVHPQEIHVEGTYHALGALFERLAGMNRLVNVENFKAVVANEKRRPPALSVTMDIVTYTYIEAKANKRK